MRLKSTTRTTVNAAWPPANRSEQRRDGLSRKRQEGGRVDSALPAANEITRGAYAAISTATGSTPHRTGSLAPTASRRAAPITIPAPVPASALSTDLDRESTR